MIGVNREEENDDDDDDEGADCWQCARTLVRQHAALKFKLFFSFFLFQEESFIDHASQAALCCVLISDVAP